MTEPHVKLSETLHRLQRDVEAAPVTAGPVRLSSLPGMIGEQAVAALLLVFAMVTLVPNIPGATSFLGLPLVGLCIMMTFWGKIWIPKSLGGLSLSRKRLSSFLSRSIPLVEKVERLAKPRLSALFSGRRERLIWAATLILAIAVLVPLPFTAMLPSFALCLIAIGMMERDGVWVLIGGAIGIVALGVMALVSRALIGLLVLAFQTGI